MGYGLQVLQNKLDRGLVEYAPIETLEADGEHIAILEPELEKLVFDREDRKWVACARSSLDIFEHSPPIVYGAETDWYLTENQLQQFGIKFIRLLPEIWYQAHS